MKRIPRPLGTTEKVQQLIDQPQTRTKTLKEDYIREYIRNDFFIHGQRMSIENFSRYIGCTINEVQEEMVMEASRIDEAMDNEGLMHTLRAMVSGLFSGALSDRTIALQQYSILAQQQGSQYVPFLTSAVNDAIKTLIGTNDQTLKVIKALLPNNGIEAFGGAQNLTPGLTQGSQGFTAEKAIDIIKSQGPKPLLEAPDQIKALEQKYNLAQTPEVLARNQSGFDASKEGLDFDKLAEKQLEAMEPDNHDDRRAHEINEDLEAEFLQP